VVPLLQPEHSVAWARSQFEQWLHDDVELISSFQRTFQSNDQATRKNLNEFLSTLSIDEQQRLLELLHVVNKPVEDRFRACVALSIRSFNTVFHDEINVLLQEHPLDETDEDGVLFWSG
jgi:hypothetical protein